MDETHKDGSITPEERWTQCKNDLLNGDPERALLTLDPGDTMPENNLLQMSYELRLKRLELDLALNGTPNYVEQKRIGVIIDDLKVDKIKPQELRAKILVEKTKSAVLQDQQDRSTIVVRM